MSVSGRGTNLALLAVFVLALVTGAGSFATGATAGRWVIWAHGAAGLGVLLLAPWKTRIVRRGISRRRPGLWASAGLAVLVVIAVAAGLGHSTGMLLSAGPLSAMQVHVGAVLVALPLVAWHVIARPARPRATDLSRRTVLRAGVFLGASGAAYVATEGLVRRTGLPGEDRRFTGSYEHGSFDPDAMPVTQWLNDDVPTVSASDWRLTVGGTANGGGSRYAYEEIASFDHRIAVTLDCTGGWFAEQTWEGVWLSELVPGTGDARSVVIRSVTGYQRRLPADPAGRLLLATRVEGGPLSAGHGFPLRLVVPGRRGFWWVKWVERIELSDEPWWLQPPFPLA